MIPLVDLHCHLLAGLDDGPRTQEDAFEMCRIAYEDGTRVISAGAHQNEQWPANTPERIRLAAQGLAQMLCERKLPLTTVPNAEVMVFPDIDSAWHEQQLLSVADRGEYLLIEMPHALYVDLREIVPRLMQAGVRPILAHPERCPELLHGEGDIEELIEAGCLVQVSASSVTKPGSRQDERALKNWFRRGVVHLLGSMATPRAVACRRWPTRTTRSLTGSERGSPTGSPARMAWRLLMVWRCRFRVPSQSE